MAASSSALSRSFPAGPTNGLPCRSSWSPGCSPTKTTSAFDVPSPKTVWVPVSCSGQAVQPAAASRSFGRLGRSGTSGAAVSSSESWRATSGHLPRVEPANRRRYDGRARRGGREVRQGPAKPRTAVRIRSAPLPFSLVPLQTCYGRATGPLQERRRIASMRAKNRLLVAAAAALVLVVSASAGGGAGGDPSFVPGPSFDAGYAPAEAVVADFNRDQKADLAVANCIDTYDYGGEEEIGSEVVILLGDGHGGARPGAPPPLPADVWTCALASADFNGDGSADLAVMDSVAKTVAVLLSDGTGHFA